MRVDCPAYSLVAVFAFSVLLGNGCGGSSKTIYDNEPSGSAGITSNGGVPSGGAGHAGGEQAGRGQSGSGATATSGAGGSTGGMLATAGSRALAGSGGSLVDAGTTEAGGEAGANATGGSGGANARGGEGGGRNGAGGSSAGGGGSAGKAGSSSGSTAIGAPCDDDGDCADGVVCLSADDNRFLGGAAPPHGLCTLFCDADDDCGRDGHCVALDPDGTEFYCVEGCTTGAEGVPKCHDRSDYACTLLGLIPTTKTCATSDDCGSRQVCDTTSDRCGDVVTGCLPTCTGDFDCGSGQYCDFRTGMCMAGQSAGLPIGSACDPGADSDPCEGFCVALGDDGTTGVCSGFCAFTADLTGCGWNGTGPADVGCVFGTLLSGPSGPSLGDVGFCGALCDCNDDCGVATERCIAQSADGVTSSNGRAGYCRALVGTETEADSIACK